VEVVLDAEHDEQVALVLALIISIQQQLSIIIPI